MTSSSTKPRSKVEAEFDRRYRQLNAQQKEAVDVIDGVVMVLAGPGTGKTELLAMRVANILRQTQLDPYNILCLTFTESGVAALRNRLVAIVGQAAYQVRVHTFHSFANEIIQEWPDLFSFARQLTVLSDVERAELWQEILDALPATSKLKTYANPYLFLPDIARAVQQLKQEHINPELYQDVIKQTETLIKGIAPLIHTFAAMKPAERTATACAELHAAIETQRSQYQQLHFYFDTLARHHEHLQEKLEEVSGKRDQQKLCTQYKNEMKRWLTRMESQLPKQRELIAVYEHYQSALRDSGRYDYEDMILMVLERLQQDDTLLAHYQEQFQYFLVDEYQDTNGAQNDLLFRLAEFMDEPNVFVVGDDHQSIYCFQGASLANLLTLHERYKDHVKVVSLAENYRSQQEILDAASTVISYNSSNIEQHIPNVTRSLRAQQDVTKSTEAVLVHSYSTQEQERLGIGKQVAELIAAGVEPGEIAVLTRRNTEARELLPVLQGLHVPTQLLASENILTTPPIAQLIELLTLVAGDTSDHRVWSVLHGPWLAIPPVQLARAQELARTRGATLLEVLTTKALFEAAGLTEDSLAVTTTALLLTWQGTAVSDPIDRLLPQVLTESGWLRYYGDDLGHVAAIHHAQLLTAEARSLSHDGKLMTVKDLLEHLILLERHALSLAADFPRPRNAVQVMTAHKAKGLEWQHVFVVHAMDGRWGNTRERSLVSLPHGLVQHRASDYDTDEDERRLFYVALTRAKKQVVISYSTTSLSGRPLIASRFVQELPATTVTHDITPTPDAQLEVAQASLQVLKPEHERELKEYLTNRLAHYTMSVTHLNNYLACPRLWYYRNLLRAPAAKTKYMALGTAVHAALFDLMGTDKRTVDYLTQRFDVHLAREMLGAADRSATEALGREYLTAYFKRYEKEFTEVVAREFNFASHGVRVDDLPLTGMIDKIELVDVKQKLVNVVDYKTGNPDGKSAAMKPGGDYHRQLVFYQLLAHASSRFEYEMVSGEIDFVQPSKRTGKFVKKKIEIRDENVAELLKQIKDVWSEIQQHTFLTAPACGNCEYCV